MLEMVWKTNIKFNYLLCYAKFIINKYPVKKY